MSANPQDVLTQVAKIDATSTQAFPNSRKIYVTGSQTNIRVPMREIALSETVTSATPQINPPIAVYDSSGPYTDPDIKTDFWQGLAPIRAEWIASRQDTEILQEVSSDYGKIRRLDPELEKLRFPKSSETRRAKSGHNVSQMHYARQGIITPEMEFVAIRENQRFQLVKDDFLRQQHAGQAFAVFAGKPI